MNATTELGLERMKELGEMHCPGCGAEIPKAYRAREDEAYFQDHKCKT
jgi:predicted RNA-binding Zn-ribbon protein involved in translation (DUF1610 family)